VSYTLIVTQKRSYLHAIVTGTNSEEAVGGYLADLLRECSARKCSRVLIEEHLQGPRLSTFPVFRVASEGAKQALGHVRAIAYVDANASGNLMQFAETVAVNRGLNVAVFRSVDAAREWLMHDAAGGAAAPRRAATS